MAVTWKPHLVWRRKHCEADMGSYLDKPPANIAFATLGAMLFISPGFFAFMGRNFESFLAMIAGLIIFVVGVFAYRYAQYVRDLLMILIAALLIIGPWLLGDNFSKQAFSIDIVIGCALILVSAIDLWIGRTESRRTDA